MSTFQSKIPSREITPQDVFCDRRRFIQKLALGTVAAPSLISAIGLGQTAGLLRPPFRRDDVFPAQRNRNYSIPASIQDRLTPRQVAATHNNFYEFLEGEGGPVWKYVDRFEVEPWKIRVTGECHQPITLDLDDLFAFDHQERVYHFRCVERWAMNVPWSGFPLQDLLKEVEPKDSARYVRFISAHRPAQMPGAKKANWYPWPYHEGLSMEEAFNDLALVVTGVYGEPLLKQHGAPVRIIVPWKYGYKSPKSIVRIELLRRKPKTFWQMHPHEYGFLSNVNPNIPHPRWSQAESKWLDTGEPFATPIFNGYEETVADLYPEEPRTPQRPLKEGDVAR